MFETSGYRIGSVLGVDVSVSVSYFFIMVLIVVFNGIFAGTMFALALTLSVLIHELGHAVICKHYKLAPSILLHGFGGLCFHRQAETDGNDVLIVVMGPVVEIIFGFAAFAVLMFTDLPGSVSTFLTYFAWVSIVWGFANLLLPLWPLDGGRLFNLILRRFVDEGKAQDWTLKVSMAVAIPVGVAGLYFTHFFVAFLAFFILMNNWNALQHGTDLVGRKAKEKVSDFARELLDDAEAALKDEDWREAYRVCHQLRSNGDRLNDKMQNRVWEILAVTSTRLGEFDEARGWLERAPDTPAVREAKEKVQAALG